VLDADQLFTKRYPPMQSRGARDLLREFDPSDRRQGNAGMGAPIDRNRIREPPNWPKPLATLPGKLCGGRIWEGAVTA
jgi:hypothetical protein